MAKRFILGALAGTMIVAGGLLLGGCEKKDDAEALSLPQKSDARVEFRPGRKDREGARTVLYAQDGKTKVGAIVPYESGKVTHIEYWTDGPTAGQIKKAKTFYKPTEGNPRGQLARELEYARDGSGLTLDRRFRENGSLEHAGTRVGAFYETYDFQADGRAFARHQRFTPRGKFWEVALLEEYYPSQVVSKLMKRAEDGATDTQTFSDTGVVQSHVVSDRFNTLITTERFDDEGKNVTVRIEESYPRTKVRYFEHGVLRMQREFSYGYTPVIPGVMFVTFYDAKGVAKYRQKFGIDWPTISKLMEQGNSVKVENSQYKLREIQYLTQSGTLSDGTPDFSVTKSIEFQDDGTTVKTITSRPVPGKRYPDKIQEFRADGTLEKSKEHTAEGDTINLQQHTSADNIRPEVDPEVLVVHPFDEIPHSLTRVAYRGEMDR